MPMANVTVKDFWLPEGKKRWVLKTTDDVMYGVPEKLSNQVRKGNSYELAYKEDHWNNRTYLVVEGIYPPRGESAGVATPQSQRVAVSAPDTSKDMHIFVCGAYNNALGNPNIDPFGITTSDKLKFITEQMEIYKLTLGRKPGDKITTGVQREYDDMNDEIPDL